MTSILYFHPAGAYGGASKSLIELYQILSRDGIRGTVLTPSGTAAKAFAEAGMSVIEVSGLSQFDNTRYGHYRGLRWLILLRELAFLPGSLLAIWRLRGVQFNILHVNEVTLLPLALVAKKLLGLPMVLHVRSLQCGPKSSLRSRLINRWLELYADAVVPIDHTVAQTLSSTLILDIVHNGLCVSSPSGEGRVARMPHQPLRVGYMGVLIALKGIYQMVEAARILKERGVNIEFFIAGENAHNLFGIRAWTLRKLGFARDVRSDLEKLVRQYGLENRVHFLGFVKDVHAVYQTLDVLCFPSYLNAAGRPVFEAAFFEVPSIVAVEDPLPDAVIHGQTGLAIQKPTPELIADAIQILAEDDVFRSDLGRKARIWAMENFSIESSAVHILRIYERVRLSRKH